MYKLIRPILFSLPPETAHHLALVGLHLSKPVLPLLSPLLTARDPRLERKVFGLTFPNPVGLAAGLDKNGELADTWGKIGFGFAELGTFTALAQPGNEGPRVFRFPGQKALINRMGFPNLGAEAAAGRLKSLQDSGHWPSIPIGINIGKSKLKPLEEAVEDYLDSLVHLKPYADYVVANVSSPNTPSLRRLQEAKLLKKLLTAMVKASSGKPVLLKLAPDLEDKPLKQAADAAVSAGCKGLIATNTTLSRVGMPPARYPEGGGSRAPRSKKKPSKSSKHCTASPRAGCPWWPWGEFSRRKTPGKGWKRAPAWCRSIRAIFMRGPPCPPESAEDYWKKENRLNRQDAKTPSASKKILKKTEILRIKKIPGTVFGEVRLTWRLGVLAVASAFALVGCVPIRQYVPGSFSHSGGAKTPGGTQFESPDDFKNPGKDAWKGEMEGIASWYGEDFNGRLTASGEVYDMYKMTAAHKTLPLGTTVKVTNEDNGMTVQVTINDRGPYVKGRIIDLSKTAGRAIGMRETGTANVKLEVVSWPGRAAPP